IELCAGNGVKAAHILREAMVGDARPHHFYANDINPLLLREQTLKRLAETGFPRNQLSSLPGNILQKDFWDANEKLWKELRESDKPTVVMLHGATFNNFSITEMIYLLIKFREVFKPGTTFFISIDSTSSR